MHRALILRAHTTALAFLHILGMVLTVKVRLFCKGDEIYVAQVGYKRIFHRVDL